MIRRAVALGLLFAFAVMSPAWATSATSAQVRELALRAMNDPSALSELRQIDVVDGKPVEMSRALDGASPSELQTRLQTLAHPVTGSASSTAAQRDARSILSGRKYRERSLPRPFAGVLDPIGRFLKRIFEPIGRHLPRPGSYIWIVIGAAVIALAIWVAYRLGRRRRAVETEFATLVRTKRLSPDDLDRAAREAEAAGRSAEAIRLRFAAGLVRLDRAGVIEWHPSITSGHVRRRVKSKTFDSVASSFERVTYGRRTPTDDDLELSKSGWKNVLEKVP